MSPSLIALYLISGVSIVLGFIALLTQKIYIDSETKQPTEIQIGNFAKLKTNIPALVFVFLGFAALFFAIEKAKEMKPWTIQGSFENPHKTKVNWKDGHIDVRPTKVVEGNMFNNGSFEIKLLIEEGASFEDAFEAVQFTFDSASYTLYPSIEHEKYVNKENSFLTNTTRTERIYKIVPSYYY